MNKAAKDTNRKVGGKLLTLRLRAKDNELCFLWVKLPNKGPIGNYILDILKSVLHNLYFEFNYEFFLQIWGIAMGTTLAPNYANLFMDRFETKALDNYSLKPLIWNIFIDDIS